MSAYLYQPSLEESTALKAAIHTVFEIYRMPSFLAEVRRFDSWLTRADSCQRGEKAEVAVTGGELVTTVLEGEFTGVHLLVHWFPNAIATTSPGGAFRGMAVRQYQVRKWSSSEPEVRADLIDTIAHEITHLVPVNSGPDQSTSRFQDRGHNPCSEHYLVSYHVGDLAACFYRQREHVSETIEHCLEVIRKPPPPDCQKIINRIVASCR